MLFIKMIGKSISNDTVNTLIKIPTLTILPKGTTGTYFSPPGCVYIKVEAVAGGGAGGGYNQSNLAPGSGGGGGGYNMFMLPAGSYSYNVGNSVSGGALNTNGADGKSTTFNGIIVSPGKGGSSGTPYLGGDGGRASTLTSWYGVNGTPGTHFVQFNLSSGGGGHSFLGSGSNGGLSSAAVPSNMTFGNGGSGGPSNAFPTGGGGAGGVVLITEFYQ